MTRGVCPFEGKSIDPTLTATLINAATVITGTAFYFMGSRAMNSGVIRPKFVGAGLRAFK